MYIFQNKKLKKKLDKIVSKTKKIKVIKKNIKDINNKEGYVAFDKKKIFYDLIILSTGGYSKFYNAIEKDRSIEKNYEELGLTSIIKHNTKIENVSQFFL